MSSRSFSFRSQPSSFHDPAATSSDFRQPCIYGSQCYRKDPQHLRQFSHPPPLPTIHSTRTAGHRPAHPAVQGPNPIVNQIPETSRRDNRPSDLLMVIMGGLPGSGKSTLCKRLADCSARDWVRVCQDVANNGKRGNRSQCINQAKAALSSGTSVLIDRCNMDAEQRISFLDLARSFNAEVHALFLDLPERLCADRAVNRTNHEGGLEGPEARRVLGFHLRKKQYPTFEEGFCRITICKTTDAVEDAFRAYSNLSPGSTLPPGFYVMPTNHTPASVVSKPTQSQFFSPYSNAPANLGICKNSSSSHAISSSDEDAATKAKVMLESISASAEHFSFPSSGTFPIATADTTSATDTTSVIATPPYSERLLQNEKAYKVLNAFEVMMTSPKRKASFNSASRRSPEGCSTSNQHDFLLSNHERKAKRSSSLQVNGTIFTGSQPQNRSTGFNEKLKMGETMPQAAGDPADDGDDEMGTSGNTMESDLNSSKSITGFAIHNPFGHMPSRDEIRNFFKSKVTNNKKENCGGENNENSGNLTNNSKHNSSAGGHGIKGDDRGDHRCNAANGSGRNGGNDSDEEKDRRLRSMQSVNKGKKIRVKDWRESLYEIAMDPIKHSYCVLEYDDQAVIIPDAYPKAKHHILILSRINGLDSISSVQKEHLPHLNHLKKLAEKWIHSFADNKDALLFRAGFHSVPSLRQLHLHVISQDFDSPCLKNKKHWNSFTTPFFLELAGVIRDVELHGRVNIDRAEAERLLESDLRCHRCGGIQPNIPRLKQHITTCGN